VSSGGVDALPFLTAEELGSLAIERMIFHVVGTGAEHPTLLDEVMPGAFAEFFLERLRSTANGITYDFLHASGVLASLHKTAADPSSFIAESKSLAETFHEAHLKSASPGAFVVFSLMTSTGPLHAFVKFDHEEVLSYEITTDEGVNKVNITKLMDTFVKSPEALQKSALIRLNGDGGELSLKDRAGKRKVSKYFETFLGVKRRHNASDLTKQLFEIAKTVVRQNREEFPEEFRRNANARIYDAIQNMEGYDPLTHDFLNTVFGPAAAAEDSKVRRHFERLMKEARIEDEAFDFDRTAVTRPARRRLTTVEGVVVTYDDVASRYIRQEHSGGRTKIIIDTGGVTEDDVA
jgi:37-kD nucleoid-associated bacterial protein